MIRPISYPTLWIVVAVASGLCYSSVTAAEQLLLNLTTDVAYVADSECAFCHSEIAETFERSGMRRSFYDATTAPVIEDYGIDPIYDPSLDLHYVPLRRADGLYQREFRTDGDGRVVHELEYRVDYIIGSGNHNRSYIRSQNGFLYEMPLTWYTQKGVWDLSPGYHERNLRFGRPIVPECMNCHNSYAPSNVASEHRYPTVPEGIGCQRCHGPGQLHINRHYGEKEDARSEAYDPSIVNPAHLSKARQVDVCLQCHLQGAMSALVHDHSETAFRPGMRLGDVRSVFVRDADTSTLRLRSGQAPLSVTGDFGIASHGERMMMSRCYRASNREMVCTTCDDPHRPPGETTRAQYRQACGSCHPSDALSTSTIGVDHSAGSDCVACHMRQGETSNILHVNFTDHWIRAHPEPLSVSVAEARSRTMGNVAILTSYWGMFEIATDSLALAEDDLQEGMAYVRYYEAKHAHPTYLRKGIQALETGLRAFPDDTQGRYYLGKALLHVGRIEDAVVAFERVIDLDPADALAWFHLGLGLQRLGKLEPSRQAYVKAIDIAPGYVVANNNLGNVLSAQGHIDAAIVAYERAVRLLPDDVAALNNLGDIYAFQVEDRATARKYLETALRFDPDHKMALQNLGTVDLAEGRIDEATARFNRLLELDPSFVPALGNLAMIHLSEGRFSDADRFARKILERRPNDVRARELLDKIERAARSEGR